MSIKISELEISIQNAFELARIKKHEFLTLEHLMLELCKDEEIKSLFSFYKVNKKTISDDLEQFVNNKLTQSNMNNYRNNRV